METLLVPAQWKAIDDDVNVLEGYASTFGNVDLQADVVQRGAFKKTIAERVPTGQVKLLADHFPAVRDVLGTVVEASEDKTGLRVRAKLSQAPSAQDTRTKLLEGHLDRMSIGYEPMRWRFEDRDGAGKVRVLEEIKLWEVSVVVFPANPAARVDRVKSALRLLRDADPEQAHAAVLALMEDDVKKALASHSTTTSDAAWDAGANEARISNDAAAATLRRAFAWVDPDADAGTKAAYRFIHHFVSEDGEVGAASTAACSAGIGVLNGARGGTTIPDADRQGVWRHLARHLRDAGQEPPELASHDPHLEVGDPKGTTQPPAEPAAAKRSLTELLAQADAVLHGRDPDAIADPVQVAGLTTRLELLEDWRAQRGF